MKIRIARKMWVLLVRVWHDGLNLYIAVSDNGPAPLAKPKRAGSGFGVKFQVAIGAIV